MNMQMMLGTGFGLRAHHRRCLVNMFLPSFFLAEVFLAVQTQDSLKKIPIL